MGKYYKRKDPIVKEKYKKIGCDLTMCLFSPTLSRMIKQYQHY